MTRVLYCSISLVALAIAGSAQAQPAANAPVEDDGEIVVSGQRAQQQRSIDAKRASLGLVDVTASDDIGQLVGREQCDVRFGNG
jgi:hypothetical protein